MVTGSPRLVTGSRVAQLAGSKPQTGWALSLCVDAREAGGSFRYQWQPMRPALVPGQPAADPVRAARKQLGGHGRSPVATERPIG